MFQAHMGGAPTQTCFGQGCATWILKPIPILRVIFILKSVRLFLRIFFKILQVAKLVKKSQGISETTQNNAI